MSFNREALSLEKVLEEWETLGIHQSQTRDHLIDGIAGNLSRKDILGYLNVAGDEQKILHKFARAVRQHYLGDKLYLRAVLEIGNKCHVDCLYCQMRRSNKQLERYQLDTESLMTSAAAAHSKGITTIMIQGGEDVYVAKSLIPLIPKIKELGLDIILCLGSQSKGIYEQFKQAGVDAYILKFESSDQYLHEMVTKRSFDDRMECIDTLSTLGFSVGSGFISGLPTDMDTVYQNNTIADDILLIQKMQFSMCSVSPFIPEENTPFANRDPANLQTTLNIIALLRIAEPVALIPSVSALQQLSQKNNNLDGQLSGLNAGANVITVNFTPPTERDKYRIYGNERFIVDIDHANSLALRAGLSKTTESSIGAFTLSEQQQDTWFAERYNVPIPLGDSVYGLPSALQCRFIKNMKGKSVVDLGCGDGRMSIPLALLGCHVVAVDDSKSAIDRLNARMEYLGLDESKLKCIQQCIFEFPSSGMPQKYKGAVLSNILYYFKKADVLKTLKMAWDLLEDDGQLFISVEIAPRLRIEIPGDGFKYFHHGNQYSYSAEDIDAFIDEAIGKDLSTQMKRCEINKGSPVTKLLPLPAHLLPYDVDKYERTYSVYELIIEKIGKR